MLSECSLLKVDRFDSSDCWPLNLSFLWDLTEETEGKRSISLVKYSIVLAGLSGLVGVGNEALEDDFCNKTPASQHRNL